MKRALLTVVLVLACGAGGWFARQYAPQLGWTYPGKQTAGAPHDGERGKGSAESENVGRESVVAMGRVEPADGVIDVGGTIGDRLGRLLAEEGSSVNKGELLAELESRELRKLELDAADCRLRIAEQRLTVEQSLADVKIEMAGLGIKKAEAAVRNEAAQENKIKLLALSLALAIKDQERLAGLSKELASDQERERQALLVQQAESELQSARAMMEQLTLTNQLGLEAARLELAAAQAAKRQLPFAVPVESLRVGRELAAAMFDRTRITAPCEGTVLKTCVRPGETIGAGPLLQIANLRRMVVVAEVYEIEVKHLRIGQEAIVSSKAFAPPGDEEGFRGTVQSIGRIISTPMLKNVDPFAPADRHVVDVRVELDEEGSRRAAALTNLQVDVRFPKRD
ncbi:MAG: efflux RND transporter periplasmic adaptor subunit [Planctomycetales bacterium]|nr:efflux RND transporter periplasmic adaptor subunit [Planctomycetales bacterium]